MVYFHFFQNQLFAIILLTQFGSCRPLRFKTPWNSLNIISDPEGTPILLRCLQIPAQCFF